MLPPFRQLVREFTEDDLLEIWSRTFDVGGEHHSQIVRDDGAVHEIALRIQEAPLESPPSRIVAQAIHDIISWHPFMDCNHRTAASVAAILLRAAGQKRVEDPVGWATFLREVDHFDLSVDQVEAGVRRFFS
jgi:hypothetical protein